jgi:hypothetical protein
LRGREELLVFIGRLVVEEEVDMIGEKIVPKKKKEVG